MKRIHHTNRVRIRIPYSTSYKQEIDYKPNGIWYGIDWAWEDWCKSEMPEWKHKRHFELKLDLKRILIINTESKLKKFYKTFGESPDWAKNLSSSYIVFINWKKVAKKYSGIEITPYPYKFRFKYMWLYTWDVASGCVWNLNAIKSVKQINKKK